MRTLLMLFGILIIFLLACSPDKSDNSVQYTNHSALFPTAPANLRHINTQYDDYNMAPPIHDDFPFFFSSNRNSQGNHFDIVKELISIMFTRNDGELTIDRTDPQYFDFTCLDDALEMINTLSNQFGPYITPAAEIHTTQECSEYLFIYADDENGHLDIKFTYQVNETDGFVDAETAGLLNSEFDDAYPTFNSDRDEIYFTSNRDETFDIYKVAISDLTNLKETLKDTSQADDCTKVDILSSASNDKCPLIVGELLVFASDRDGGYGGYDLWYSELENGTWSTPVNFGAEINSEFDEFRPVVRYVEEFKNTLMIFSSNRPGGEGGFDLYYVGIPTSLPVQPESVR